MRLKHFNCPHSSSLQDSHKLVTCPLSLPLKLGRTKPTFQQMVRDNTTGQRPKPAGDVHQLLVVI